MRTDFWLIPLRNMNAYCAKPMSEVMVNFDVLKKKFPVKEESKNSIVLDGDIVVHDFGEILFKSPKDANEMMEIARNIYDSF